MSVLVLGEPPAVVAGWLAERRRRGQDGYDEVWDGVYHVAPIAHSSHGRVQAGLIRVLGPLADAAGLVLTGPFNLGSDRHDFRVPATGLHWREPATLYVPTAALVVEVVSPGDETWAKTGFYAEREVAELLVADPACRSITLLVRTAGAYQPVGSSGLLGVSAEELASAVDWPSRPAVD